MISGQVQLGYSAYTHAKARFNTLSYFIQGHQMYKTPFTKAIHMDVHV
jgi:hypothetical protein